MTKLAQIVCERCGRQLAITLPTAEAYCWKCMRWSPGPKSPKKNLNKSNPTRNCKSVKPITKS